MCSHPREVTRCEWIPAVVTLLRYIYVSLLIAKTEQMRWNTYVGRGAVIEDLLDSREYLRRELGDDLERLKVVDDLLGFARTENNSRCGRLDCKPRKCEMGDLAVQFYGRWSVQFQWA